MSPFTVSVYNIKAYLVDFLLGQYEDYVEDDKLIASLNIYPGQCIVELLSPQPKNEEKQVILNEPSICLILPYYEKVNVLSRNFLSFNAQTIFKKRMRAHFKATLINFIEEAIRGDIDFVDAIDRFMEMKKINPDHITKNALINRIQIYYQNEQDIIDYYTNKGMKIGMINGEQAVQDVFKDFKKLAEQKEYVC